MPFTLHDYVNSKGINEIKKWIGKLQSKERAKLDERLDKLRSEGPNLYPQILCGTTVAGIQKIRVHGKVQLRPMVCQGPINHAAEYTLLSGAKEVGFTLIPKGVEELAHVRKLEIVQDHNNRRCPHGQDPKKSK